MGERAIALDFSDIMVASLRSVRGVANQLSKKVDADKIQRFLVFLLTKMLICGILIPDNLMKLNPLYTIRFFYPDGWEIKLRGPQDNQSAVTEEEHFYLPEGRCEGGIVGEFRGANHPHRRVDKTFVMNLQGFIKSDDGATIMTDYKGYGRAQPKAPSESKKYWSREVVGAAWHVTDSEKYRWLNNSVCAIAGEVRVPDIPDDQLRQADVKLVFDVAEIAWESPTE